MTELILFAIGAAGAFIVAFAALGIFTVVGSTRRSRTSWQPPTQDELDAAGERTARFIHALGEDYERRAAQRRQP